MWSCGVTLYVMLVGAYPFEDPDEPKNFRKTIQVPFAAILPSVILNWLYILIADTNAIYLAENIGCAVFNSRLCPHISRVPGSYF